MFLCGILVFFLGFVSIILNRKHFISFLLRIEIIMLGVLFLILGVFIIEVYEVIIFFFVLAVREASLGLGILILSIYFYGEDLILSFKFLEC